MERLSQLPNIGKEMEKRLASIGIYDIDTLTKTGSKEAFTRLHLLEGDTCFSSLCGLEGAIQGIRWHHLSSETKQHLKKFFNSFKKKVV
jgi:DNA transformation protein